VKLSERRSNAGGEGEGAEYKPKNKKPTQRCEEKNHSDELCDDVKKKSNKKNHVTEIQ
jgi:hypothetical protein